MIIQKLFILITLSISLIIFTSPLSIADVTDIDADVVANVTFNDDVGGDVMMQSIDISWNATYSGYLYFFAHDSYWGVHSVINGFTGNPDDNIELGIMDDPTFLGYELRGWRIGYVYSGTTYNIGGSIYEPGTDECDGGPGAYFRRGEDWSYSGGYTGHEVSLSPGRWNACSGGDYPVVFLLIESPPPVYTLSGYVNNTLGNPINSVSITLSDSGGSTTSNITGYYEITGIESGTYTITATVSGYENYIDTISITEDTTKNITLSVEVPTEVPTETLITLPLPIQTGTPLPIIPPEEDFIDEIIDDLIEIIDDIIETITELLPEPIMEVIEETVKVIEETVEYLSTSYNWILLITAYIGAFVGKNIFNKDEDYAEIITSTFLIGTIGWIIVLLINFFVPIISLNEIVSILIFTTSGFIIAAISSSIQPETEKRTPRRPHH